MSGYRGWAVLAVVGLMVGISPAAHATSPMTDSPRTVDLGTLGGTNSFASAQNELGQVIGASDTATGQQHAFSWTKRGGMVDLGTLGGDNSSATAVNAAGQVTGYSFVGTRIRGFSWTSSGGMVAIGALGDGQSQPAAISPSGQIVGGSTLCEFCGTDKSHAFSWTPETGIVDLGTLGGEFSTATSVTPAGRVFGISSTASDKRHVFSWTSEGGMVDLGTPPGTDNASLSAADLSGKVAGSAGAEDPGGAGKGFSWSQGTGFVDLGNLGGTGIAPKGINAVGQVTGFAETSSGDQRAFLWDPRSTTLKDLGTLGGGWSSGEAISASGQVVGYSNPPGVDSFRHGAPRHAFSWTKETGMIDLGLIGGVSSQAAAVNKAGQVAGQSQVNDQSDTHAVIWQISGT